MKNLIFFLIAFGIPQPYQDRTPSREPTVLPKIEAVIFRDETAEYFRKLRFYPSPEKLKRPSFPIIGNSQSGTPQRLYLRMKGRSILKHFSKPLCPKKTDI